MTLLKILLKNYGNSDLNKPIDEIVKLVNSCIPKKSGKSADYNIALMDFYANLNQKGLVV